MMNEKDSLSVKVQWIELEEWNNLQSVLENGEHSCTLFWTKDKQDVKLLFYSNNRSIRPLEFMDYLVQEYVLVQGDNDTAQAVLTPILLQAMMSDFEVSSVEDLLDKLIASYFSECDWIYTVDYAKEQEEAILQTQKYVKKKVTWEIRSVRSLTAATGN